MTDDSSDRDGSRGAPAPRKRAVAMRYDDEADPVPRMVAKGEGPVAERIIDVARQQGITIYEDPDLIELLCKLDVDQMIPEKLFTAVAEVMAYVYRMNNRAGDIEKIRAKG